MLILISILGWSAWSILNKMAVQKIHPIYIQITSCCVGIILIPVYIRFMWNQYSVNPINFQGIILTSLACLCATIASISYMYGIRTGEIGTISVLSSTHPVLTFIIASIFLNESVTPHKILGVSLVILGVIVLGLSR